jgi:hypothetical protein
MTRGDDRKPTLAAALDRILWDNSSTKDRRFLLAPLSRIFEGISWDFKPRQGEPMANEPDENVEP